MDLLKNKNQYFTPEELAVKKIIKKNESKSSKVELREAEEIVDLEKYKDLDGVTLKTLDTGFWLVKNRGNFILIRNLILGFFGVIFLGFFISTFGNYFIFGMNQESVMINRIVQGVFPGHDYFSKIGPRNLSIGSVKVFDLAENKYDFFVELNNLNASHWAEIEYSFSDGENNIDRGKAAVLPSSKKYILALGKDLNFRPLGVNFIITKMRWHRIDPHKYGNWDIYRKARLEGIDISDASIVQADKNILTEKVNLNTINFVVKNNTGYNYGEAKFVILLYSGGIPVGIHYYIANDFHSGIEINPGVTFPGLFPDVDKIEIMPDIDIVYDDVFADFKGKGFAK